MSKSSPWQSDLRLRLLVVASSSVFALSACSSSSDTSTQHISPNENQGGSAGTTNGTAGSAGMVETSGTSGTAGSSGTGTSGTAGASAGSAGSSGIGGTGSGGTSGMGTSGTAGSSGTSSNLPPIPPPKEGTAYPVCGPDQTGTGYVGSCCVHVTCRDIDASTGACPDPTMVSLGVGSGTCSCEATLGPFAPSSVYPTDIPGEEDKPCCYLAGIIGCEGRPLIVDNRFLISALVCSSLWI
jgi:hypothetical protein